MTLMPRFTRGGVLAAGALDTMAAELESAGRLVRVRRSSPLQVASSTDTVVGWQVEDADTNGGGMWDPGSNFVNVREPGTYTMFAQHRWDDPGQQPYKTGMRHLSITVDGTNPATTACRGSVSEDAASSRTGRGLTTQAFALEPLVPGQRIYVVILQDSGSTLVAGHQNFGGTFLAVCRVAGIN